MAISYGTSHTHNYRDAEKAINTVKNVLSVANEVLSDLSEQIQWIPDDYGQKDQLGENVEETITEMDKTIEDEIITPLQEIVDASSRILEEARRLDKLNENYQQRKSKVNLGAVDYYNDNLDMPPLNRAGTNSLSRMAR